MTNQSNISNTWHLQTKLYRNRKVKRPKFHKKRKYEKYREKKDLAKRKKAITKDTWKHKTLATDLQWQIAKRENT